MSGETDWDDVWELARAVLENGAPLNLTDETRALLLRVAQEVAISKQDAEDALRSLPAATTMLREIDRRIHDGSWRLTDARNQAKKLREEGDFDGAQQVMRDVLSVEGSIASRDGRGGTAEVRVREQLDEIRQRLA